MDCLLNISFYVSKVPSLFEKFDCVDFSHASLVGADFRGVNFKNDVCFFEANLENCKFDEDLDDKILTSLKTAKNFVYTEKNDDFYDDDDNEM